MLLMKKDRLKILFLTARFLYPMFGGDRVKPFHLLKHLGSKHDVSLVSFFPGGDPPEEYVREIEKTGVKLIAPKFSPVSSAIGAAFKNLVGTPLEIGYYYRSNFRKIVDELIKKESFDLAIAFNIRTSKYIKDKNVKKILIAEDCRTPHQKGASENSKNFLQKVVRFREYKRLRKFEPEIVKYFDVVTYVTAEDIAAMKEMNPNPKYRLLTNGTDVERFTPPAPGTERRGLLFAGRLDIWGNITMLQRIVKRILPAIREELPEATLNIVGAWPSREVLSMESDSVGIIREVPSLVPYLQQAKLFIHPHGGGAGIQNKLLEAMACGCPVVTTSSGVKGIPVVDGESVLIGNTDEELTENCVKLLKDDGLVQTISKNCAAAIRKTHSWEAIYAALDDIIEEVVDER